MPPPADAPSTSGSAATRIGRYRIAEVLGCGAMGTVYRAEDPLIERTVALKVLNLDLSLAGRAPFREHFFREGKAAGRLTHPNIVTVYDIGESDGVPYIAMEFLEGLTLRETLDSGSVMPVRRVVDIGLAVCRGLEFAHANGVIHRDIKPANIMLTRAGMVKIMDFGIARSAYAASADEGLAQGEVMGSPKYMAPEQLRGELADARADLYALAVTLYELLVGRNPFDADSVAGIADRVVRLEPPTAREQNPDIPIELDLLLLRAMQKDPGRRFGSARDMARVLRSLRRELRAAPDGGRTLPVRTRGRGEDGEATVVLAGGTGSPGRGPRRGAGMRWLALAAVVVLAGGAVLLMRPGEVAAPAAPAPPPLPEPTPLAEVDVFVPPVFPLAPVDEVAPQALRAVEAPARAGSARRAAAPEPRPPASAPATLRLAVLPWGQVFVDGKLAGVTPPLRELSLAAGRHRIEIRNLDFAPYVAELKLESGQDLTIGHRFGN